MKINRSCLQQRILSSIHEFISKHCSYIKMYQNRRLSKYDKRHQKFDNQRRYTLNRERYTPIQQPNRFYHQPITFNPHPSNNQTHPTNKQTQSEKTKYNQQSTKHIQQTTRQYYLCLHSHYQRALLLDRSCMRTLSGATGSLFVVLVSLWYQS